MMISFALYIGSVSLIFLLPFFFKMKIVKRSYKKSSKLVQLVCVGRTRNQKQICSDTKAHVLLIVAHSQTRILTFPSAWMTRSIPGKAMNGHGLWIGTIEGNYLVSRCNISLSFQISAFSQEVLNGPGGVQGYNSEQASSWSYGS